VFADKAFANSIPALDAVQTTFAAVPALWQFEIASALRKAMRDGRMSTMQMTSFMALVSTLDIRVHHTTPTIERLLLLAGRHNISTYDAAYLDLAMQLGLPLATLDRDLAGAAELAGVPNLIKG